MTNKMGFERTSVDAGLAKTYQLSVSLFRFERTSVDAGLEPKPFLRTEEWSFERTYVGGERENKRIYCPGNIVLSVPMSVVNNPSILGLEISPIGFRRTYVGVGQVFHSTVRWNGNCFRRTYVGVGPLPNIGTARHQRQFERRRRCPVAQTT